MGRHRALQDGGCLRRSRQRQASWMPTSTHRTGSHVWQSLVGIRALRPDDTDTRQALKWLSKLETRALADSCRCGSGPETIRSPGIVSNQPCQASATTTMANREAPLASQRTSVRGSATATSPNVLVRLLGPEDFRSTPAAICDREWLLAPETRLLCRVPGIGIDLRASGLKCYATTFRKSIRVGGSTSCRGDRCRPAIVLYTHDLFPQHRSCLGVLPPAAEVRLG